MIFLNSPRRHEATKRDTEAAEVVDFSWAIRYDAYKTREKEQSHDRILVRLTVRQAADSAAF